ncbi:MAG: twin-arginine translocation signal domain-containing protein [Gemmobacter sp.]|nr:twin-arginine translocation signal domain-containing protein [Gemmobacter sp.]
MTRNSDPFQPSRRGFLGLAGLGAGVGLAGGLGLTAGPASAAKLTTKARIVIIGAGAGGTALVNRLVQRLDGAADHHHRRPGRASVSARPVAGGGGAETGLLCGVAHGGLAAAGHYPGDGNRCGH